MNREKIGRVATIFGCLFTMGLVLLGLEYCFDLGLPLLLVSAVLGIGLLGVIVFGSWYYYF